MSIPASVKTVFIKVDVLRQRSVSLSPTSESLFFDAGYIVNKIPKRKTYFIKVNPLPFETDNSPSYKIRV